MISIATQLEGLRPHFGRPQDENLVVESERLAGSRDRRFDSIRLLDEQVIPKLR